MIETALGVVVAWMISYVPKLIPVDESGEEAMLPKGSTKVRQPILTPLRANARQL